MAKAWERFSADADAAADEMGSAYSATAPLDWRERMSDHIAYALLVYTGLQIFVTISMLKGGDASLLPYLALVMLVVVVIPSCGWFERRWHRLSDAEAADPAVEPAYRRDRAMLWIVALVLPFVITGLFRLLSALFG